LQYRRPDPERHARTSLFARRCRPCVALSRFSCFSLEYDFKPAYGQPVDMGEHINLEDTERRN
jgi:hypothetical protein